MIGRANELFFGTRYFGTFGTSPADPWPIRVDDEPLYLEQSAPLAIAAAQRAVGLPLVPVEMEGRFYTDEEIERFNYEPANTAEYGSWPGKERGAPKPVLGDRRALQVSCDAEGQAREVLAAWLAAQAVPFLADLYHDVRLSGVTKSAPHQEGALTQYWRSDTESWIPAVEWNGLGWVRLGGGEGEYDEDAVLGSPTATDLAAQLLERPNATVAATVAANWEEWTDPATSIQAIIDEFELQQPPTPKEWIERGGEDPADYTASIATYPRWIGEERRGDQLDPICK